MATQTIPKILLVGDSQIENTSLKNALTQGGCKAVGTTDTNEAKQILIKNWPDFLIFSFYEITQAESFYRELIFACTESNCELNESILLCRSLHEAKAFELCVNGFFYMYLLERPFSSEYQLRLAVHLLQEKLASKNPPQTQASGGVRSYKIMVVEDEEIQRKVMEKMIVSLGHTVSTACDGEQALAVLGSESIPHLILMDIRMPKMNGFEAITHIKENNAWQKIPIIILSSNRDIDSVTTGIKKGAVDFIVKPVSKLILKKKLESHLGLRN